MASKVRVKRPPSVRNERRTRRRISDQEMGLGEASASRGQDEQAVEDVREVLAGHGQHKQGVEDVREVPAGHQQDKQHLEDVREGLGGCRQVKQDPGGARQAPASHRKS